MKDKLNKREKGDEARKGKAEDTKAKAKESRGGKEGKESDEIAPRVVSAGLLPKERLLAVFELATVALKLAAEAQPGTP